MSNDLISATNSGLSKGVNEVQRNVQQPSIVNHHLQANTIVPPTKPASVSNNHGQSMTEQDTPYVRYPEKTLQRSDSAGCSTQSPSIGNNQGQGLADQISSQARQDEKTPDPSSDTPKKPFQKAKRTRRRFTYQEQHELVVSVGKLLNAGFSPMAIAHSLSITKDKLGILPFIILFDF